MTFTSPKLQKPADPQLVSLTTLQHWLWQRLQAPAGHPVAA